MRACASRKLQLQRDHHRGEARHTGWLSTRDIGWPDGKPRSAANTDEAIARAFDTLARRLKGY
jgi:hypothetical protein